MSFITYAQNFEDVMLRRALKQVGVGFYIDVGAWSPNIDSVTRAFYEAGWHGINVEPNPEFYEQLVRDRPRDTNIRVAVGDHIGTVTINFVSNPGLSTANDDFAAKHLQDGLAVRREEVRLSTLTDIWQTYVPSGQEVHFLKIDVEGLEEAVVKGNDWNKYRPWILLIEATLPMSQVESYEHWEPTLLDNGYIFAYADGLNRFYIASEHSDLIHAFRYPPNVFDDFLPVTQVEAQAWADRVHASAEKTQAFADEANKRAEKAELSMKLLRSELDRTIQKKTSLENELFQVYQSRSWKITAPLRWFATQVQRARREGLRLRFKALLRKSVLKARHEALNHPQLLKLLKDIGLHAPLKHLFLKVNSLISSSEPRFRSAQAPNMSLRTHQFYSKLKSSLTDDGKAKK